MKVIRITGPIGSGKSGVLRHLAGKHEVYTGCSFVKLLQMQGVLEGPNFYVDDANKGHMATIEKEAKKLPHHFRLFAAGENI